MIAPMKFWREKDRKLRNRRTFTKILVSKEEDRIKNRYNQVPHLTEETKRESDKHKKTSHKREPRG